MADQRALDADLQLDCDLLILDYIIYKSTASLLEAKKKYTKGRVYVSSDLLSELQMVESLLTIIKSTHAPTTISSAISSTIRFRLQLLRFTTLFALRQVHCPITPSKEALASLNRKHAIRAKHWWKREGREAFPEELYAVFEGHDRIDHTLDTQHPRPSDSLLLLDLIPSFIDLTAARARVAAPTPHVDPDGDHNMSTTPPPTTPQQPSWTATPRWLSLVSEMMLHAFLEACLSSPATPPLFPLLEAFSWGPSLSSPDKFDPGSVTDADEDSTPNHHDHLFILSSETSNEDPTSPSLSHLPGTTWRTIRARHLQSLIPPPSFSPTFRTKTLHPHLCNLKSRHPLSAFEAQMFAFLGALHQGLEEPVLVQLEEGGEGDGLLVDGVEVGGEKVRALRALL